MKTFVILPSKMHIIKQAFLISSHTLAVKRKKGLKIIKARAPSRNYHARPLLSSPPLPRSVTSTIAELLTEMQQVASVACNSGCKSGAVQQMYFAVLNLF